MSNIATPPIGLHRYVEAADYHSWPCLSSGIIRAGDCPRAWKHAMENRPAETGAMRFGTALHRRLFEPEWYARTPWVEVDEITAIFDGNTRASKRTISERSDEVTLGVADSVYDGVAVWRGFKDDIERAVEVIESDPEAKRLIDQTAADRRELSFVWEQGTTGLLCKGRADALSYDGSLWTLLDMKTSTGHGHAFDSKAKYTWEYPIQMAHYTDGLCKFVPVEKDKLQWAWIVYDKTEPGYVEVVYADESLVTAATQTWLSRVHAYSHALLTGVWGGPISPRWLGQ